MRLQLLRPWNHLDTGFVLPDVPAGAGEEMIRTGAAKLVSADDTQPAKKEKKAHAPLAGYATNR